MDGVNAKVNYSNVNTNTSFFLEWKEEKIINTEFERKCDFFMKTHDYFSTRK